MGEPCRSAPPWFGTATLRPASNAGSSKSRPTGSWWPSFPSFRTTRSNTSSSVAEGTLFSGSQVAMNRFGRALAGASDGKGRKPTDRIRKGGPQAV